MKYKLLLIISSVLICSNCQNQPYTRQGVVKILTKEYLDSLSQIGYTIDKSRDVKFDYGFYSSLNKEQCLVELPMIKGDFKMLPLFLFEKPGDKWIYSGVHYLDTYENKIIDYNKDGLNEILTTYAIGLSGLGDRLICLNGNQIKVLYQNHSNWMKSLQSKLIIGDTISITYEIGFFDIDSDDIDEIKEKKISGVYKGTNGNVIEQEFIEEEKIIKLKN